MKKMKPLLILLALGLIAAFAAGCSGADSHDEEIKTVVEKVIHSQYNVNHSDVPEINLSLIKDREETLKPYLTEELLNNLEANGDTALPVRIASHNKADLAAEAADLNITTDKDVKETYDLTYATVVKLTDESGTVQEYKLPSEATAVRTSEGWVLSRLRSDYRLMAKLYP